MGVLFAAVATMIALGLLGFGALPGLLVGEVVLLALPIGAALHLGLPGTALGLRRPQWRALVAAVLIGCTTWYVNVRIVELLPFREGVSRSLDTFVERPPLWLALAAIALAPAVCEEVLFRGAVQRALATRLYPAAAVVLASLLFAGYHMSLIQLVPTFTLALLLGTLAHRADSVMPAMLAHFLNNAMAILVTRRQPAALADWLDGHPSAALATCVICTTAGALLALEARA